MITEFLQIINSAILLTTLYTLWKFMDAVRQILAEPRDTIIEELDKAIDKNVVKIAQLEYELKTLQKDVSKTESSTPHHPWGEKYDKPSQSKKVTSKKASNPGIPYHVGEVEYTIPKKNSERKIKLTKLGDKK